MHVRGPTTFEDLRTVDAVERATFQEACLRHGFLQDDSHPDAAMSEAALTATASQLRHLFAAILAHSVPSDPERLWRNHDFDLCEDYLNADLATLQPLANTLTHLDLAARHQRVAAVVDLTRLTALRSLALPRHEPLGDISKSSALRPEAAPPPSPPQASVYVWRNACRLGKESVGPLGNSLAAPWHERIARQPPIDYRRL